MPPTTPAVPLRVAAPRSHVRYRMTLPSLTALAALTVLSALPAHSQSNPLPAAEQVVPPGFGSLGQDDLTLKLRTPTLEVRFLPLDTRVSNLLANDAYKSLSQLVERNRPKIDSVARDRGVSRPGIAFVSFYGIQAGAFFDASVLAILFRGRLLRPIGIVSYTPQFSEGRLEPRQLVSAFYLFEEQIPVLEPFQIQYYNSVADWGGRLSTINSERQRVAMRAYRAPVPHDSAPRPAPR